MPFDPNRLEVLGTPVAVLPGVRHPGLVTAADFGVSRTGTLIYVPGPESGGSTATVTPVWVDRQGRQAGPVVNTPLLNPRNPRLSPDGTRLLVISGLGGRSELSVYRLDGRPPLPLAQAAGIQGAIWSRDGTRVFFASNGSGGWASYSILSDGSVLQPQPIPVEPSDPTKDAFLNPPAVVPQGWMPDGRLLLAGARRSGSATLNADLVTVPAEGGKAEDLIRTEYVEDSASVSPDGQWLSYRSTRSGRPEIWVRAVAGSAPVRVSQNGGREPLWSRDGRELYYLEGNKLVALAVKPGQEFSFGAPTILFDQPYFHGFGGPGSAILEALRSYDVAKDGRFIMIPQPGNQNVGGTQAAGIVVVQNWSEELKAGK